MWYESLLLVAGSIVALSALWGALRPVRADNPYAI